jgi:hypothetical protein
LISATFSQKKIFIINAYFSLARNDLCKKLKNFYKTTLFQMVRNLQRLAWTQGQILKAQVGAATRRALSNLLLMERFFRFTLGTTLASLECSAAQPPAEPAEHSCSYFSKQKGHYFSNNGILATFSRHFCQRGLQFKSGYIQRYIHQNAASLMPKRLTLVPILFVTNFPTLL